MMKVILLDELKGRGGEGDVVEVATGYAVNYLFPRKLAITATKGNLKQLELRKHNIAKRESERLDTADKLLAALEGQTVRVGAKVGEEGQLFGSITPAQVAEALTEKFGVEIDRKRLDLHGLIKKAGEHTVTVSIYRDVKANVIVDVVDEKTLIVADAETEVEAEIEAAEEVAEIVAEAVEEAVVEAVAEEVAEEAVAEAVAEEVVAEALAEEIVEEVVEEAIAEAVAEEIAEEAVIEAVAEELSEEIVAEEIAEEAVVEAVAEEIAEEAVEEVIAEELAEETVEIAEVVDEIEGVLDAAVADAAAAEVEEKLAEAGNTED
jgi:large subunit ribosomal protein L9